MTQNHSKLTTALAVAEIRETKRSKENLARARKSLALGVSSGMRASARPCPLYIERGYGPRFVDVDGNEFIDHCLAWGPLILGHSHPAINDVIREQLDRGHTFGAQCELEFLVAEKIRQLVPCAERVLFSNTGTEAVHSALRIARAATGRTKVIKFEGHYHGWFNDTLVSYSPNVALAGPRDTPSIVPASKGQIPSSYAETVVLPWNDEQVLGSYLDQHGQEVAAIITEPILCNNGCIFPKPEYLQALRRLATQHGIVLIFDEVITGFRVHIGGAQSLLGVVPDMAIFGKAIAGGFAFSVISGKEALIREVDEGRVVHAGTFNGNPIALSAALATISTLTLNDGAALRRAQCFGESVIATLKRLARELDLPLDVMGHGAVFIPVFGAREPVRDYRDFAATDRASTQALIVELFNRGIYCVADGRWYVSAVHGDDERDYLNEHLPKALESFAENYKRNGLAQESKR
ncbi:MAG TPA: aspartate aminotransferase family protein [Pyrinomonadaceae bacterium]|nr:aspartate aminotransferase family protein [Pyrinomonadaceae bacterium]